MKKLGTLYLIPTVISENTSSFVLPEMVIQTIYVLDEFIVEDEKTARRFLKSIQYPKSLNDLTLHVLNKHTNQNDIPLFIQSLEKGKDVGLLSEAGCPCIADPGSELVALAHRKGFAVKPLVGPSSILLALIASGFNGQHFLFHGYLPIEKNYRIKKIKELELNSKRDKQTHIFMETPFRNMQLLSDILNTCHPETQLCIAADITGINEFIQTKSIYEWKKSLPELHKRTAIFLLST